MARLQEALNDPEIRDEAMNPAKHTNPTQSLQSIRAVPERPSLRNQRTLLPWRVSL
jgi:hypothetical protein